MLSAAAHDQTLNLARLELAGRGQTLGLPGSTPRLRVLPLLSQTCDPRTPGSAR